MFNDCLRALNTLINLISINDVLRHIFINEESLYSSVIYNISALLKISKWLGIHAIKVFDCEY